MRTITDDLWLAVPALSRGGPQERQKKSGSRVRYLMYPRTQIQIPYPGTCRWVDTVWKYLGVLT